MRDNNPLAPAALTAGLIITIVGGLTVAIIESRFGVGSSTMNTGQKDAPISPALMLPTPTSTRAANLPAQFIMPTPTIAFVKYKVIAGDNLIAIAARYRASIQAIMAANGMKDDTLRVGEEIIIPLSTPTPFPGS